MSFDDDLNAQLEIEPDFATVDVLLNGKYRTLRFTELDGLTWADLGDRCPPRPEVPLDRAFGYNIRLMVALAAPICGEILDEGEYIKPTDEQWTKLFRGLKGAQVREIGNQLFELNQYGPAMAVAEAKKAYAAESASKLLPPVISESAAPGSLEASPEK